MGEIAHAVELSPRGLQILTDNGLTPDAHQKAKGKAGAALYDLRAFMHFTIVGGLHKAGLPLLHAGRLALNMEDEFSDFRLGYISRIGMQCFARERGGHLIAPEGGEPGFWLHHWLRSTEGLGYVPGEAWDDDIFIWVADRRYALIGQMKERTGKTVWGELTIESGPTPVCEIEDVLGGVHATAVYQRPEWNTEQGQRALLNEYRDALRHAVGLSQANISLAIRRGLDRVHDLRMEKGGKLFPN